MYSLNRRGIYSCLRIFLNHITSIFKSEATTCKSKLCIIIYIYRTYLHREVFKWYQKPILNQAFQFHIWLKTPKNTQLNYWKTTMYFSKLVRWSHMSLVTSKLLINVIYVYLVNHCQGFWYHKNFFFIDTKIELKV